MYLLHIIVIYSENTWFKKRSVSGILIFVHISSSINKHIINKQRRKRK